MGTYLKEVVRNNTSKLTYMEEKDKDLYEFGLVLLGNIVSFSFLDIPELSADRNIVEDGLYYSIPCYERGNTPTTNTANPLLSVHKVKNGAIDTLLEIEADLIDCTNYRFTLCYNTHTGVIKKVLMVYKNGLYASDIRKYDKLTLSEMACLFN